MRGASVALFVFTLIGICTAGTEPVYNRNFKYQTEESMKASASEIPYGGYNVYEGSYYPRYTNYQGGYDGYGGYGNYGPWNSGYYNPGFRAGYYNTPYVGGNGFGSGYSAGFGGWFPHSGGYSDKKYIDSENKKSGGQGYHKAEGSKGESGQHGSEGFVEGQVAVKDIKGDSGYYKDEAGDKKVVSDGKTYQGGQHYNEQGGKGKGENGKSNHKKGYAKKGFKKSHHKDEAESEESFYDEAHDEGDKFHYNGNEGAFGTKGQSAFKGGHEKGEFATDQKGKQGHFEKHESFDKENADKGQYGQKGYHGNSEGYSVNNGFGQQSLLGKQEANRVYHNHYPHGYVPVYPEY